MKYAIWNTARSELIKWMTNPCIIIISVMLVFIRSFAAVPLLERAEKYDEPLNVLETFIAVCNSGTLVMLELKAQGKTILIASHSTEDIAVLCDTVCEMDRGALTKVK